MMHMACLKNCNRLPLWRNHIIRDFGRMNGHRNRSSSTVWFSWLSPPRRQSSLWKPTDGTTTVEAMSSIGQFRLNSTHNDSEKGNKENESIHSEGSAVQEEVAGTTITFVEKDPDDDEESEGVNKASKDQYTVVIPVRMPDMGEGENKILKWYKQPGDWIKRNDILCDIQTPDFTFGLVTEDEFDSIMGEIFYEASEENSVDDEAVICNILHQDNPGSSPT